MVAESAPTGIQPGSKVMRIPPVSVCRKTWFIPYQEINMTFQVTHGNENVSGTK